MDPAADEQAPDELFVRPVVRIPGPSQAEASSSSCEISGKRQRSQVCYPAPPPPAPAQRRRHAISGRISLVPSTPRPARPSCEPRALSVMTARTEMLSAREGAHPQFLSAVGPQSLNRGTCPWACAGGSANCEHQRPGERIAATIAPAVPVLDLVVMPWLLVEFRSCRCRGCVRANWRGRVPRLPALHRGEQANLLTAARQKKS